MPIDDLSKQLFCASRPGSNSWYLLLLPCFFKVLFVCRGSRAGSVELFTTAEVIPLSPVPELKRDNNKYKVCAASPM